MWEPNLNNTSETKHGNIIGKAKAKFQQLFPEQTLINKVQDKHGIFAWEFTECFLVAKGYIYGNIVSTHLKLTTYAASLGKKLVMYIDDCDKFYEFDPDEAMKEGRQNTRGDVLMLNFPINLGKRIGGNNNGRNK